MAGNPMKEPTKHGYNAYELMSAMQKFIRRSKEKEALFCFYELESSGMFPHASNRLLVIIYEDVGIQNEPLLHSINSHIIRMNEWYKKDNGAWRLILGNIILSACRGYKTRMADQFVCAVAAEIINGYRVNFDEHDYIYDMHTFKGKKMGRGADHFYHEASKIELSNETTNYFQEEIDASDIAEGNGFDVLRDYGKSDEELKMMSHPDMFN